MTSCNCLHLIKLDLCILVAVAYPSVASTDPENGVMGKGWGIGGYLKEVGISTILYI